MIDHRIRDNEMDVEEVSTGNNLNLMDGFLNNSYTFTFNKPLAFLNVKGPFSEGGV